MDCKTLLFRKSVCSSVREAGTSLLVRFCQRGLLKLLYVSAVANVTVLSDVFKHKKKTWTVRGLLSAIRRTVL